MTHPSFLQIMQHAFKELYKQMDKLLEQLGQNRPEGLDPEAPFDPWVWEND